MELKAIIGKMNGSIEEKDIENLKKYFIENSKLSHTEFAHLPLPITGKESAHLFFSMIIGKDNANKDVFHMNYTNSDNYLDTNQLLINSYVDKGKNLLIKILHTNNPLAFYQFLSKNGYILKDSKLKQEYQK